MFLKLFYAFQFVMQYLFQLLRSNIYFAGVSLSPKIDIKYGFLEVPLNLKTNFGLLLFSNLVSMTPGSLVTDINQSKTLATVHVIFLKDEKQIHEELNLIQNRIKKFTE